MYQISVLFIAELIIIIQFIERGSMKFTKDTSSPKVLKHAASAALVAAMLAPASAQVVYAQDADQPQTDQNTKNTSIQNDATKTKHRDEAQANYDKDLLASKDAQKKVSQAQEKLNHSDNLLKDAQVKNEQAYTDAQNAFDEAKKQADDTLKSSSENLKSEKENLEKKKADLAKAEKDLKDATQKKDELEDSYKKLADEYRDQGKSPEKFDESQSKLNESKNTLDEALATKEQAQAELDTANEDLAKSKAEHAKAVDTLKSVNDSLKQAQKKNDQAQDELKSAQDAYNESLKDQDAQKLSKAKEAKKSAQADYDNAQKSLKADTAAYAKAEEKLNQATVAQKKAQATKDAASKKLSQAQANLDSKQKEVKQKQTALKDLDGKIAQAKSNHAKLEKELDATNKQLDAKKKDVARLQSEKDKAQKAFDEAKSQVQNNQDIANKLNEGAFGFFKSLADDGSKDAKQALYILEHSDLHDAVQKGNPLSSTAYENILTALDYIDAGNAIRQRPENNLPALKVSHTTMAMAMVNADWATKNIRHSYQHFGAYYNGENAAWGMQDPYSVWYDHEKAYYDSAVANGEFDPNNYESFVKWGKLPSKDPQAKRSGKNNEMTVGHYITLVEKAKWESKKGTYVPIHFETTGYGFSRLPIDKSLGNFKSMTHIQDFASHYIVKGGGETKPAIGNKAPAALEVYTTDEYRDLLKKWKDSLTSNNFDALEQAQTDLQDANAKLDTAKSELSPIEQRAAQQKKNADVSEKKLIDLTQQKTRTNAALTQAQGSLKSLEKNQQDAQTELTRAQQALTEANSALGSAQKNKDVAKTNLDASSQRAQEAQAKLNQKVNDLQNLEKAHRELTEKQEQLNKLKAKAQSKAQAAKQELDKASALAAQTNKDLGDLQADVDKKQSKAQAAQTKFDDAKQKLNDAQLAFDAQKKVYDALAQDFTALKDAQAKLEGTRQDLDRAKQASDKAAAEADVAQKNTDKAQAAQQAAKAHKDVIDGIEFKGVDTPATNDASLDQKIEALKQAKVNLDQAMENKALAQSQYDSAEQDYKNALSDLVKSKVELDSYNLKIINGAFQKVDKGNAFSFRINKDPEGLSKVLIDGEVVPTGSYSVYAGSTILTFNKDLSSQLKLGKHTLKVIYDNGAFAQTEFTVEDNSALITDKKQSNKKAQTAAAKSHSSKTPATSDSSFIGSIAAALAGFAAIGFSTSGHRKND